MTDLFEQVAGLSAPATMTRPQPAAASSFSASEILAELDHEIAMRVRVFGLKVDEKTMQPGERDRRIAIMKRVRAQCAYLGDNAEFFRACLRHREQVETVLKVLDVLEPARVS